MKKIYIFGKSYKPDVKLIAGSSALLLADILHRRGVQFDQWDPHVDGERGATSFDIGVFFIATKHSCFRDFQFPSGSVVIDPFRYMPEQDGVKLIQVGKGPKP